ncbi:MAG: hypothetical protein HYU88_13460 [Chloroflexi bacterium]|nr:hypothetical protein [Chloroflexota bacterium]
MLIGQPVLNDANQVVATVMRPDGQRPVLLTPTYTICPLYDRTKAAHGNAIIPIKLQLCDTSGTNLSSPAVTVHVVSIVPVSGSAPSAVVDAGNANPDDDLRYSAGLGGTGGYIFNLSTRGLGTGTYDLRFTAGRDPVVHAVQFQVK